MYAVFCKLWLISNLSCAKRFARTLFFLFYFNRLFASIVSGIIRFWTWHKYRVYFDVQALQISLLGGRIFFKGLRYHGNNETILVHSGFITWTYWLRNVRELKLERDPNSRRASTQSAQERKSSAGDAAVEEKGGPDTPKQLPSRLSVEIKGLEWFIYNRSPAYDTIIAALAQDGDPIAAEIPINESDLSTDAGRKKRQFGNQANLAKTTSIQSRRPRLSDSEKEEDRPSSESSNSSSSEEVPSRDSAQDILEQSFMLRVLPVHIECTKASVVLGNENTKSIFITKADKFMGDIDVTACRAPDLYRQMYNFDLVRPVVQLKPNDDFKEDQTAAATRARDDTRQKTAKPHHSHKFWHRHRRQAWHKLQDLVPYFSSSVETFTSSRTPTEVRPSFEQFQDDRNRQWQGLSRYLNDDEADEKAKWSSFEYATVTTILDSPEATISYYWDEPGKVPDPATLLRTPSWKTDINGTRPPEWGIDVHLKGATVNYGPWADRQRADLQRVFFPGICKDAIPPTKLKPGDTRIATALKIYIQLDDDTVLRVPIREESKTWKWKAHDDTMTAQLNEQKQRNEKGFRRHRSKTSQGGPEIRPFGWLDLKLSSNATINYTMDMVAGKTGFSNYLKLDLPALEVTTSVNHGLVWRSLDQQLTCDLSNPLGWNALHNWHFDFRSNGVELFILREHIFLLTDLVEDWTTGPPPDYLTFVPFQYHLNLRFGNFKLYFNVNDSNIINNPSDMDDNTFLVVFGTELTTDLSLPIERYRPHRNHVKFDVKAHTGGLFLHVPQWNTQSTFLINKELVQLQGLAIDGKYEYCDTTASSNTDTLFLDVSAQMLELQLYGFFIRYLMKVKDNYFGEDMHFRTLDEYQLAANSDDPVAAALLLKPPFKKTNDLDVVLNINVDQIGALLPTNLYSANRHVRIDIACLAADLRFTSYYMDLNVSLSPLSFSLGTLGDVEDDNSTSGTQLYVDGVEIYGNRLFGLPPAEPTYLCNWDLNVGDITGETSAEFLMQLTSGAKAFAFSFDDDENALPEVVPLVEHDVTFLRASVAKAHVWVHVEDTAFLASTGRININFNDWATALYSKKLKLSLPDLVVSSVDSESASRHRSRSDHPVETHAYIATTLEFTMVQQNAAFYEDRRLQQEHIRHEDSRTHRTQFFLLDHSLPDNSECLDPPAMWVPPVPVPLAKSQQPPKGYQCSLNSSMASSRGGLRRKSSFLSMSSSSRSSQRSIRRTQSRLSAPNRQGNLNISVSRSRSRHAQHLSFGSHMRDSSVASTGRQSSFYSAIGVDDRRALQSSSVEFSSPFLQPYFPLENVWPDTDNVPEITSEELKSDEMKNEDLLNRRFEDNVESTSFIIEMKQGIRAYVSPEALRAVVALIEVMQPTSPDDILDTLQTTSMGAIFDANKQKLTPGKKMDVSVQIPVVRLRFANDSRRNVEYDNGNTSVDQYDLAIMRISMLARSALAPGQHADIEPPAYSSAIHARIGSVQASATENNPGLDNSQAAINARIHDVVFWVASNEPNGVVGALDVNKIGVEMSSADLEFLASLLHHTAKMASEQSNGFAALGRQQQQRIQLFALLLSTRGRNTADAHFLTKPSYVLRSSPGHLRTTDSWKAITRMRHVYNSLPKAEQSSIQLQIGEADLITPGNVRELVQTGFEKWRSWDLDDLPACVLMNKIFGPAVMKTPSLAQPKKPTQLAVAVENVNFVLDPGPEKNEIAFATLTANFEANPSRPVLSTIKVVPTTVLELYCANTSINLNWKLCELAANILKLYNKSMDKPPATPVSQVSSVHTIPHKATEETHFQLVVVTDEGSITLDSINMHVVSLIKGMKASIVVIDGQPGGKSMITTLFTADAATTKLASNRQEISLYQIRSPTVNISCETYTTKVLTEKTWKIAGNASEITFVVNQEPVALLDIVDKILGDEVIQIKQIADALPDCSADASTPAPTPIVKVSNRINIALFLDKYLISVPLLHSLRYEVSGVIARATFSARQGKEFVFDFDIKENQHDMEVQSCGKPRKLSILQLPPTNGRISAQMGAEDNKMSVFVSVEPIFLDAAAIQQFFSALNRPEISGVTDELRHGIQDIKWRIADIFIPEEDQSKTPSIKATPPKPFVYDAHLSLAGLEVYTDAPNGHAGEGKARLTFNLGYVQIEALNRIDSQGPLLDYPELQVNLRRIVFNLRPGIGTDDHGTCGNFAIAAYFAATSTTTENGDLVRSFNLTSKYIEINLYAETASTIVNVVAHIQNKIKDLDLSREVQYLQRLRTPKIAVEDTSTSRSTSPAPSMASTGIFAAMFSLDFSNIQVSWIVARPELEHDERKENLVLSLRNINLSTRKKNAARLTITDLMLQMVPPNYVKKLRSHNSALLPLIVFTGGFVTTETTTRVSFSARGLPLDLRLNSHFATPGFRIKKSIESAAEKVRAASASWMASPSVDTKPSDTTKKLFFGKKRMESFQVDAKFDGAVVYLQGMKPSAAQVWSATERRHRPPQVGKYGQFSQEDPGFMTTLHSPGLAVRTEYLDDGVNDPTMKAEVNVASSENILFPQVAPLIMEITENIQAAISSTDKADAEAAPAKSPSANSEKLLVLPEDNILTAGPTAVLGKTKLNLGIRVCAQQFTLSCQPHARVLARAEFDGIYVTMNTVESKDQGHFFAIASSIDNLQVSVQHVYSRDSTASFEVRSTILSLMNSKHLKGVNGMSAILKISPMIMSINARQLHDFLIFRDIWVPSQKRQNAPKPTAEVEKPATAQSQEYLIQRYQEVAQTAAFPWNATVLVEQLDVHIDLGQSIGKPHLLLTNLWVSAKKNSGWEQNLCLGFERIAMTSTGRLSGFAALEDFCIRTSIQWPEREKAINQTPLVQGAVTLNAFKLKVSFDYQAFLIGDISSLNFLLYNVRSGHNAKGDRLVSMLDGDSIQIFCTTATASLALAMYQAFEKLAEDNKKNYQISLRELEKGLNRKLSTASASQVVKSIIDGKDDGVTKSPITLHSNLLVNLKRVDMGVYPATLFDSQVFKLEAENASFRFAVSVNSGRVHSSLGTTLGGLRVGLAPLRVPESSKIGGEINIEEIINIATSARGGTILEVPKVEATMETWQSAGSRHIDYIFRSSFDGKVKVGWNYSRISFIRGMYEKHAKALAQRLGKPLPPSAVKITGLPDSEDGKPSPGAEQRKIRAEVNAPDSKYEYEAIEPPLIEAPQLKDMAEATPPLEWIGLHRDKLPNLTHQIVIVSLLELASEVEDAYAKILGSS